MPQDSILPDDNRAGGWITRRYPEKYGFDRDIQGWKIHVAVNPMEIEPLFDLLTPMLRRFNVYHKVLPFQKAWNHDTSKERFQQIGRRDNTGEGKYIVIYPADPLDLQAIVMLGEAEIRRHRAECAAYAASRGLNLPTALLPYPGGTKGDLPIGKTGLFFTRYGCFAGDRLHHPVTDDPVADPRFRNPFPEFFQDIPNEIRAIM